MIIQNSKKRIVPFLFLFLAFPSFLHASPICDGTLANPCVAEDVITNTIPKHWRDAFMILAACKQKACETAGLQELWISGSAEPPTAQSWQAIHQAIEKATAKKVKQIIDFDLRQESHGYINGRVVTLSSKNDW